MVYISYITIQEFYDYTFIIRSFCCPASSRRWRSWFYPPLYQKTDDIARLEFELAQLVESLPVGSKPYEAPAPLPEERAIEEKFALQLSQLISHIIDEQTASLHAAVNRALQKTAPEFVMADQALIAFDMRVVQERQALVKERQQELDKQQGAIIAALSPFMTMYPLASSIAGPQKTLNSLGMFPAVGPKLRQHLSPLNAQEQLIKNICQQLGVASEFSGLGYLRYFKPYARYDSASSTSPSST